MRSGRARRQHARFLYFLHGLVSEFRAWPITGNHEHEDGLLLRIARRHILETARDARREGHHIERPQIDMLDGALLILPATAPGSRHRDEGLVGVVIVHHRPAPRLGTAITKIEP